MKDVMASLPEVIKEYKGYNLLIPTATDVQLNPFYKFHVEEVAVDLSETSGDIFKVGSVDTGRKDDKGNKIYADAFSLSKPLLNKMAMAAGIQFNPEQTYGERINRVTYRAHAQGAMRKADGTCRTETDQKEICLEDEEEKYRIEFSDKAARGITDDKQAKAAAEIFKGTWTKAKNKWGKTVDAYVIDEVDREKYIERSVMVNMALLKKTWAEKAITGAKLRVIRALLGVKGTYTKEEEGEVQEEMTVKAPDIPWVRKGDLVHVTVGTMNAYYYVIGIRHDVDSHSMTLDLHVPFKEYEKKAQQTVQKKSYNVGDIVNFHGGTHYVSSYAGSRGYNARAGRAKITIKNGSGKIHPWHLIHVL